MRLKRRMAHSVGGVGGLFTSTSLCTTTCTMSANCCLWSSCGQAQGHEGDPEEVQWEACSPQPIDLQPSTDFNAIKSQVRAWLGLPQATASAHEIIKLRRADGTLLPLSCLLAGSSQERPFLLDVARVHQTSPASPRLALLPTYMESVRSKLNSLERRIERVESLVPEFRCERLAHMERALHHIGAKVSFLDRRMDELAPPEWKAQLQHVP